MADRYRDNNGYETYLIRKLLQNGNLGTGGTIPSPIDTVDYEVTCVVENDNLYLIRIETATGTPTVVDFTGTDVTGTVTPTSCASTLSLLNNPYCVDGVDFTRVDVVDTTVPSVSGVFWLDNSGAVVPDPTPAATNVSAGSCSAGNTSVPGCFQWINGNVIEEVVAYAQTDSAGAFANWVVLSGNPPLVLTDPAALTSCNKAIEKNTLCLQTVVQQDATVTAWELSQFSGLTIPGIGDPTVDVLDYFTGTAADGSPTVPNNIPPSETATINSFNYAETIFTNDQTFSIVRTLLYVPTDGTVFTDVGGPNNAGAAVLVRYNNQGSWIKVAEMPVGGAQSDPIAPFTLDEGYHDILILVLDEGVSSGFEIEWALGGVGSDPVANANMFVITTDCTESSLCELTYDDGTQAIRDTVNNIIYDTTVVADIPGFADQVVCDKTVTEEDGSSLNFYTHCFRAIQDDPVGSTYITGDLIEQRIVFDQRFPGTNPDYFAYYNQSTNNPVAELNNGITNPAFNPSLPVHGVDIVPCDAIHRELRNDCLCDDVNGDGSVINTYVDIYDLVITNGNVNSFLLGSFTDKTGFTPYTPANPIDCEDIGSQAVLKASRRVLETGTWSPDATVKSFRVHVVAEGLGVTFTDSDSVTSTMFVGVTEEWFTDNLLSDGLPVVTAAGGGSQVIITYISI